MAKKAMAKKESTELQAGFDFMQDIGGGMEGADKDSFAIPFMRVLQKISPQCDEADAAYVEGAKGGKFFNSVTGELTDEILFVPCAFQRRFLRWAPRGSEQGFKGELMPEEVAQMRADGIVTELDGKLYVSEEPNPKRDDRLVDTRSHFGLVLTDEGWSQVLMPLSSTQIKKSKQLMSILSSAKVRGPNGLVTPPTWMNKVKVTSVQESNDQGSWYGVKFEHAGYVDDADLYAAGKAFHDSITAGELKANYAAQTEEKF